ncbi:MAG: HAD family phosphatase [Bacteroidota bacterium]|nr:HAD family phosphatase [Bacteroidota bacterium]MDP4197512.1 HAD family phosphatase [Bacteroidota bacterium]
MEKRKYSVVVFDLGNVLIPFDYTIMINKLDKVKSGLGKRFMDDYKANYSVHRSFERGDIKEDDFLELMLSACERAVDKETFCRYYSEIFTENKEVTSLLPELKKKYKLVLLSNTNGIHREYGYKHYEFFKYFDKLILSHEVGSVKPEAEIYRAVENFTGHLPEEHIFIDDVADYAEGARKMGWDAIQFKNAEQLKAELRSRNILE